MTASRTARERVRAELTREITDIARHQLASHGADGLSLRAVAREMGMVSSAIYRYFATKDDLLTALIIDGYNALGAAVEEADAAFTGGSHLERWLTVCRAVREWALAHPHEYALLYGSPVPGYQAPAETVAARIRDVTVYGAIIRDAYTDGAITDPTGAPSVPAELSSEAPGLKELMHGVPDPVVLRALSVWTGLFGWVNFELFGQFNNTIEDRAAAFDHSMRNQAWMLGLAT